ncbi:MAG: tetratricopeptide repeat protein [Deltaproteobacteria bacterium]|nr:tetratricopeptide repeat protein [Deltaproteobacteria bacterium]
MKMQGKIIIFLLLFSSVVWAKSDWDFYQKYGHTSAKWDSLVEAGLETFDGGNLDTAQNFLQRAAALGCKDGLVQLKLAQIIEAKGNLSGAAETILKLKPLLDQQYPKYPQTRDLAGHLGRLYYQLEKYDKALPFFLEAIEKQGENFLFLYLAGQIYRMQEKKAEAITFFEKALQQKPSPESPGPMVLLASLELMRLYFAAEQFDKALQTAEAVLDADPAIAEAQNIRDEIRRAKYKEKEHKTWERILNR